jgi:predicted secreted protein
MAVPIKLSGKAGSFVYSGTTIPFKSMKPKTTRDLADTTDSSNYDVTSDLVHKAQLPVTIQTEVSIEGNFDLNTTDASLITQLYSGGSAVACVFNLSATKIYGHGNFDISDFETSIPVDDIVTFTATLKSNGIFTRGS